MLFNFHTHTNYCDGEATAEEMVTQAITDKFSVLGFSTHSPVPFASDWNTPVSELPKYFTDIAEAQKKHGSEIEILLGLEVDYISGEQNLSDFDKYKLDYMLGGVHYVGHLANGQNWELDWNPTHFAKGLKEAFGNNENKMLRAFFNSVNELIEQKPDILAHLDLIKKFNNGNRFFDENGQVFESLVIETLALAAEKEVIVEINTRGWYKGNSNRFYPDQRFFKKAKELKVPLTISSDAHHPSEFKKGLKEVSELLVQQNINEIYCLTKKGPVKVPLSKYIAALQAI